MLKIINSKINPMCELYKKIIQRKEGEYIKRTY